MKGQKGRTPDERFLIKLFEIASAKGDVFSEIEIKVIAAGIGYKETATKNMVKLLAQANFIKKADDTLVYLTPRGVDFVNDELS